MTTNQEVMDEFAKDEADEWQHARDLAATVGVLGAQIRPLEATREKASKELKQWLGLNPRALEGGPFQAGEWQAVMQGKSGGDSCDFVRLLKAVGTPPGPPITGQGAILELARLGLLRLDVKAFREMAKHSPSQMAELIERHVAPLTGTDALIVTKGK